MIVPSRSSLTRWILAIALLSGSLSALVLFMQRTARAQEHTGLTGTIQYDGAHAADRGQGRIAWTAAQFDTVAAHDLFLTQAYWIWDRRLGSEWNAVPDSLRRRNPDIRILAYAKPWMIPIGYKGVTFDCLFSRMWTAMAGFLYVKADGDTLKDNAGGYYLRVLAPGFADSVAAVYARALASDSSPAGKVKAGIFLDVLESDGLAQWAMHSPSDTLDWDGNGVPLWSDEGEREAVNRVIVQVADAFTRLMPADFLVTANSWTVAKHPEVREHFDGVMMEDVPNYADGLAPRCDDCFSALFGLAPETPTSLPDMWTIRDGLRQNRWPVVMLLNAALGGSSTARELALAGGDGFLAFAVKGYGRGGLALGALPPATADLGACRGHSWSGRELTTRYDRATVRLDVADPGVWPRPFAFAIEQ